MELKTSFFKERPITIIASLSLAFLVALIVSSLVWLIDQHNGSSAEPWYSYGIFASLGFCTCLSFYDDKYTGLRLLGTIIGAVTGILTVILMPDGSFIRMVWFSVLLGVLFALIGYFIVGYHSFVRKRWHW